MLFGVCGFTYCWPGTVPRHHMEKKTIDKLSKLASILEARPYNMAAAATALRQWVTGTEAAEPMPAFPHLRLRPEGLVKASMTDVAYAHPVVGALGLEPQPSIVRVVNARPRLDGADTGVSAEGHFVYDLAHDLVREHDTEWPAAIKAGERAWQHLLAQGLHGPVQEAEGIAAMSDGDDDVGAPLVLDEERPVA